MRNFGFPFPVATFSRENFFISTDLDLLDIDTIHCFLSEESYWAKGIDKSTVERSIQHSLCFGLYSTAVEEAGQVGFARVISDYTTYAYLADVFILEEHRGQGLGKWLLETILSFSELQALRRWALYTKDVHDLYRRFGFDHESEPERYMVYRPGVNQET